MKHKAYFIIPSSIEKYYRLNHADYQPLPPMSPDCGLHPEDQALSIVYPVNKQKIYLPYDFTEERRKVTFEAAHSVSEALVFWHLDDLYIGQSSLIHQMEFQPAPGKHTLTLTDEFGNSRTVKFEVLKKNAGNEVE